MSHWDSSRPTLAERQRRMRVKWRSKTRRRKKVLDFRIPVGVGSPCLKFQLGQGPGGYLEPADRPESKPGGSRP
jgi:hypothetical protein